MEILLLRLEDGTPTIRFDLEMYQLIHEYFTILREGLPGSIENRAALVINVTWTERHFHTIRFHFKNTLLGRETELRLPAYCDDTSIVVDVQQTVLLPELCRMFKYKKIRHAVHWLIDGAQFQTKYERQD